MPDFWSFKLRGFSLIELMVVIGLFGLAASVITASYVSFERTQRSKSAALQLKGDIRLVQNKAISGDKGPVGSLCQPANTTTLEGWYIQVSTGDDFYTIAGDCQDLTLASGEKDFESRTIKLPQGMTISKLSYGSGMSATTVAYPAAIFFRPLNRGVSFHDARFGVDYFDNGVPKNVITSDQPFNIEVSDSSGENTYVVKIKTNGEIDESKL